MHKLSKDITSFTPENSDSFLVYSINERNISSVEVCNQPALYSRLAKYFDGKRISYLEVCKIKPGFEPCLELLADSELRKMYNKFDINTSTFIVSSL